MKNNQYWTNRMRILEESLLDTGYEYVQNLEKQYSIAIKDIETEIAGWYLRFAKENNITLAEANRMLTTKELEEFRWSVEEYIKYAQDNVISKQWTQQLKNASARVHVSRLDSLKIQLQQQAEALHGRQSDALNAALKEIYQRGYYHTAFEIQKSAGVGWSLHSIDDRTIKKVLSRPWTLDGQTFSDRIWTNKQALISSVNTQLTQSIMRGAAPDKAIKAIAERFKVSKSQAGRLIMTESAAFSNEARKDCFKDLGVEKYVIVETLDNETCSLCAQLDGKVYPMSEYQVGVTAPPFHPWCRGTTAPYYEDMVGLGDRAARNGDGKTYYVPKDMKYPEWEKAMVNGQTDGLKLAVPDDTIKSKKETIQTLDKLKQSGIPESEYDEYLGIINNHENPDIIKLYKHHADEITKVKKTNSGSYSPVDKSLVFDYPKYDDMNKYGTLAHEYGHFFDAEVKYEGLHFNEIQAVQNATGLNAAFKEVASSSDEFLAAIRKDKKHIRSIYTTEAKADLIAHNASSGVQDAIDGLFPKSKIKWGHGERYYNRKYAAIEFMDKLLSVTSGKKKLQQVYKDLGLDASNQAKVKTICRQYEAASEAWANIMSAEVCGGEALEYVKKYLPNSYAAMLGILKGVK